MGQYARVYHEKSPYHFNSLNEFSLNITPAFQYDPNFSNHRRKVEQNKSHMVLIWPDRLIIDNLFDSDIDSILELCMKDKKISLNTLQSKLSNQIQIIDEFHNDFPEFIVISSISNFITFSSAVEVLDRFHRGMKTIKKPMYFISTMMGGHRNASHVLTLPYDDAFEFLISDEHVQRLITKYSQSS
jgi:hypothetical protein